MQHPDYYGGKDNVYECLKVINNWLSTSTGAESFYLGNALKYIKRCGKKPDNDKIKDIDKAIHYLSLYADILREEGD